LQHLVGLFWSQGAERKDMKKYVNAGTALMDHLESHGLGDVFRAMCDMTNDPSYRAFADEVEGMKDASPEQLADVAKKHVRTANADNQSLAR